MQIKCPSCDATIDAKDVNLDRMVAKCASCNAVFDFSDQLDEQREDRKDRPRKLARKEVPLPQSLTVNWKDEVGEGFGYRSPAGRRRDVAIVRRWFQPGKHLFMLVFAIGWNAFLVFWYGVAFTGGGPWIMFVFPLIHVAVGVGIGYGALAGILNRTTIHVASDILRIRHAPLPWRGNREVPVDELEQLYCTQKEHRGKNGVTVTYEVRAATKAGAGLTLLQGLPEAEQALFIEQTIEKALGIVDVAMPEEFKSRE